MKGNLREWKLEQGIGSIELEERIVGRNATKRNRENLGKENIKIGMQRHIKGIVLRLNLSY